jgi:hypothetical protein
MNVKLNAKMDLFSMAIMELVLVRNFLTLLIFERTFINKVLK